MVANSLARKTGSKPKTFSAFLTSDAVKRRINAMVGGAEGQRFISGITSAVSVNPSLSECDHSTILSAALLGESLKLSPSPQLGYYYMVPFNDKKHGRKVAQFQLGYKGYIQLAIRSGQYKKINVLAIKEGELEYFDPLNEEIRVNLMVENWDEREAAKTIGYYADVRACEWIPKGHVLEFRSNAGPCGQIQQCVFGCEVSGSSRWENSPKRNVEVFFVLVQGL